MKNHSVNKIITIYARDQVSLVTTLLSNIGEFFLSYKISLTHFNLELKH